MMNISNPKMSVESLESILEPSSNGHIQEKLIILKPKEDNIDIQKKILLPPRKTSLKKTSVIVEYPPEDNLMILKDKLDISQINTLTTSLFETLDQDLILKEKDLKPFWTKQSKEISEKLWLPTKIDYVDSVLTYLKTSSKHIPMGQSWFSIEQKHHQKQNLSMTSCPSLQFSLPDSMAYEVIQSKKKSKTPSLKTLKGRFLPTQDQKDQIQLMMEQSHWYYNFFVSVIKNRYGDLKKLKTLSYYSIRDLLSQYDYIEESDDNRYFKLRDNKEDKKQIKPPWWTNVFTRIPRGVAKKISQNINSMISNYHNKNINDFELKFKSKKKSNFDFILFEDSYFPAFFKEIKSQYWFTNRRGKKQKSTFKELINESQLKGFEVVYDKIKDHYYFHYPVDYHFYPKDDRRNESQINFVSSEDKNRITSLDPGIRKFLVGYDPNGIINIIGNGANKDIIPLLYKVDKNKGKTILWRKIKNKISEMHWKTISFLTRNYDKIMIPNFKISKMVKGKKLGKMTKRMLYMYSFHSFLEKLKFKCRNTNKKLFIVNEDYTSKTCTNCGHLNDIKTSEIYECKKCKLIIDRDINASRNILIKNIIT